MKTARALGVGALILLGVLAGASRSGADPPAFHCEWNTSCPEITVAGDPPATLGGNPAPFRGYGDPSLERDPVTGELWMAYSWLDVLVSSPGPPPVVDFGVRTHLARSTDGGATFSFERAMNATTLGPHPVSSQMGWMIHEVPTITRRADGTWEALWLSYFDPQGGEHGTGVSGHHYVRSVGDTPEDLGDVVTPWIGSDATPAAFGAVHNLNDMPELADCTVFTEPALITDGGETYLATNCAVFDGAVRHPELERLVLLREDGDEYDYIGVLLDYADAVAYGGERIEQVDLVVAENGAVLLIGTPIQAVEPHHLGCQVFEVLDLETAAVRTDGSGVPVSLLEITGDDAVLGPGLCTYEAGSATGAIEVLHDFTPSPFDMEFSMRATGQHPQGVDGDGDGRADTADNCPAWPNAAQGLPAWPVPASDPDCDGFSDAREVFITTDAVAHCSATAALNDEPVDAWPPDFNDSRRADISDVVLFGPSFNKIAPNPAYNARFDLNADSRVNISDVVAMGPYWNKTCVP